MRKVKYPHPSDDDITQAENELAGEFGLAVRPVDIRRRAREIMYVRIARTQLAKGLILCQK